MSSAQTFVVNDFIALTVGIIVYFSGVILTRRSAFLRDYNIPEPVSGGLFAALVTLLVFIIFDISVEFKLYIRNILLIYFFTAIGLNARVKDLISGGKPLILLLGVTICYMFIQNVLGLAGAQIFGLPDSVGVLTGSASLVGGHGTAIAWAPVITEKHGVQNAMEIGVASATFGLILASLVGGPIAKILIERNNLKGTSHGGNLVGIPDSADTSSPIINHNTFMGALLTLHIAIIIGYAINQGIEQMGLNLPLFVTCLLVAIVMSNTIPGLLPNIEWPARTPALALISDYSLNIFLAMSLMSMQLWTLAGLAGPLLAIMALQAIAAVLFVLLIFYRIMGSNYEAAVLSAGFGGFVLGATPTAIANMTAVAKKHGPAPNAFIVLPLVAAFFVDIANVFIIGFFVG